MVVSLILFFLRVNIPLIIVFLLSWWSWLIRYNDNENKFLQADDYEPDIFSSKIVSSKVSLISRVVSAATTSTVILELILRLAFQKRNTSFLRLIYITSFAAAIFVHDILFFYARQGSFGRVFCSISLCHDYLLGALLLLESHDHRIHSDVKLLHKVTSSFSLIFFSLFTFARAYSLEPASFRSSRGVVQISLFLLSVISLGYSTIRNYGHNSVLRIEQLMWLSFVSFGIVSDMCCDFETAAVIYVYVKLAIFFVMFTIAIGLNDQLQLRQLSNLLRTKEMFVDFVAREVRTPLQKLIIMLSLLQERLEDAHKAPMLLMMKVPALKFLIDDKVDAPSPRLEIRDGTLSHSDLTEAHLASIIETFDGSVRDSVQACDISIELLENLSTAAPVRDFRAILSGPDTKHKMHTIAELFEDVDIFKLLAKTKNITLLLPDEEHDADILSRSVNVDKLQLRQVIGNLLSNAIKFTHPGKVVEVTLMKMHKLEFDLDFSLRNESSDSKQISSKPEQCIGILVKDQGFGISKENQKKLFKSVVQFNTNAHQGGGGSGIGLQMAYNIVKDHGGDMQVHSEGEGHGSVFFVGLPLHGNLAYSTLASDSMMPSDLHVLLSAMRILIIADGEYQGQLWGRALMSKKISANMTVSVAAESGDTLAKMDTNTPYDFIFIDRTSFVYHGAEAMKTARDAGYQGLIVVVTDTESSTEYLKACGANEVLCKPFSIDELKNLLKAHLGRLMRNPIDVDVQPPAEKVVDEARPPVPVITFTTMHQTLRGTNLFLARVYTVAHKFPFFIVAFLAIEAAVLMLIMLPWWDTAHVLATNADLNHKKANLFRLALQSQEEMLALTFNLVVVAILALKVVLNAARRIPSHDALTPAIISMVLIIQTLITLVYCIPESDLQLTKSLFCCATFIVLSALYFHQYRFSGGVWNRSSLLLATLFDALRILFIVYEYRILGWDDPSHMIRLLCLLFNTSMKFWHIWKYARMILRVPVITTEYIHCAFYSLVLVLYDFTTYNTLWNTGEMSDIPTPITLASYSYIAASVAMVIAALQSLVMFDRIGKQSMLDERRKTVRHASHEIRSPLNIVYMGMEYLSDSVLDSYRESLNRLQSSVLSDFDISPEMKPVLLSRIQGMEDALKLDYHDIGEIHQACKDVIAPLNDLLTYEKLETDSLVLEKTALDAKEVFEAILYSLISSNDDDDDDIRLHIDCALTSLTAIPVVVDDKKLHYAFQNLLAFARRMKEANASILIAITPIAAGSRGLFFHKSASRRLLRTVAVHNSVAPSQDSTFTHVRIKFVIPAIANADPRFSRKSSAWRTTISAETEKNLGMFVAKGIIDLHGGSLMVYSAEQGRELAFTVDIPIAHGAVVVDRVPLIAIDSYRKRFPAHPTVPSFNNSTQEKQKHFADEKIFVKVHILCVDDSSASLKMLCRLLVSNGICDTPETACDGQEALEKIKASLATDKPFQLVLMDSEMPNMDGPTAAKLARESGFRGMIIGITGNGLLDDINHFKSSGANEVIVKPISIKTLKKLIVESKYPAS